MLILAGISIYTQLWYILTSMTVHSGFCALKLCACYSVPLGDSHFFSSDRHNSKVSNHARQRAESDVR